MKLLENFLLPMRKPLTRLLQVAIIVSSFILSYQLRFDFSIPEAFLGRLFHLLPLVLVIKMTVFWRAGLFHGWWRYVSMSDLITIFKANIIASLLVFVFSGLIFRLDLIPRSVLILDGVFCFLLMGGVRFFTRAFRENYLPMPHYRSSEKEWRILIVGAGSAGQMIVREIRQNDTLPLKIIGFIDDDPLKKNQRFQGVQVLGRQEKLARLCHDYLIDEVIIAIPSASGKKIKNIVDRCQEAGVKYKTLPRVGDLINGRASVQNLREVTLDDLLGRETVRIETNKIKSYIKGKRVLITGAGGSIGSEICRQVARFEPSKIILFDNAETSLFNIERELVESHPDIPILPIVGDVRYRARVEAIFDETLPEVVFHAAAYKHVPMMEINPAEAVNNNVRGTQIVADAAQAFGVLHFVMVSTDKAVRPTNVMGASKRAAEIYIQSLAQRSKTNFVTVRFGNVLGSAGSVVPIFQEQIRKGGPVKVTHPEVMRYFMTIPEATQLVLQAGSMGRGGEIFLLDMGAPVKIVYLAEELIRLSGLKPYEDIDIIFTGLRPGEKLFEELLLDSEGIMATSHEKIRVAKACPVQHENLLKKLERLNGFARQMDLEGVITALGEIVPEYRPESRRGTGDRAILWKSRVRSAAGSDNVVHLPKPRERSEKVTV
jgi:FlaA1/EpsC-like NDP-sugar epimerase